MIQKKINLIVLLLFYGFKKKKFLNLKKTIDKICKKLFQNPNIEFLVIDNKTKKLEKNYKNIKIIKGNNSCFDFSGWDSGLSYLKLKKKIENYHFFCFANDTFLDRNYTSGSFIQNFNKKKIKKIDMNSAIGFVDDFPKKTFINNLPCKEWIRSNIFFLSSNITKKIKYLTFPVKNKYLFNNSIKNFFKTKKLSSNWVAYISSWLFKTKNYNFPEYKLNWIKSKKLNKKNYSYFKIKSKAIMSEHFLTARIKKIKKFKICNINFNKLDKNRHIKPYYLEQKK